MQSDRREWKSYQKSQRPRILKNTNDDNHAVNNRMEIKILKAIEVAKKEAQHTRQRGGLSGFRIKSK